MGKLRIRESYLPSAKLRKKQTVHLDKAYLVVKPVTTKERVLQEPSHQGGPTNVLI